MNKGNNLQEFANSLFKSKDPTPKTVKTPNRTSLTKLKTSLQYVDGKLIEKELTPQETAKLNRKDNERCYTCKQLPNGQWETIWHDQKAGNLERRINWRYG